MTLDPLDLDAFQASLPEPMQALLAEARGTLFGAASEPFSMDSDDEEPDLWMDDDFVSESIGSFIARIGRDLLSSVVFWDQYKDARAGVIEVAAALQLAVEKTTRA